MEEPAYKLAAAAQSLRYAGSMIHRMESFLAGARPLRTVTSLMCHFRSTASHSMGRMCSPACEFTRRTGFSLQRFKIVLHEIKIWANQVAKMEFIRGGIQHTPRDHQGSMDILRDKIQ